MFLHRWKGILHAGADVHHGNHLERDVLGREIGDGLWLLVFVNHEVARLQSLDEPALVVGHDRRDLDDVDVDFFRDVESLGLDRAGDAPAAAQHGAGADVMWMDAIARVPVTFERLAHDFADLLRVGEEDDFAYCACG